jgi:GNAT superfamily N-acetyltransferase
LLAELNHQLIRDGRHRNNMDLPQLTDRMRAWLANGEYAAQIFEEGTAVVAYALFRDGGSELYLRQMFVVRDRRRQGIGRQAMQILRDFVWPKNKRLTVAVLSDNTAALGFYRALGYVDYSVTLEIPPSGAEV